MTFIGCGFAQSAGKNNLIKSADTVIRSFRSACAAVDPARADAAAYENKASASSDKSWFISVLLPRDAKGSIEILARYHGAVILPRKCPP
jgi:hypothetical protein